MTKTGIHGIYLVEGAFINGHTFIGECISAGIIDSAEAQMKLNLNEWAHHTPGLAPT